MNIRSSTSFAILSHGLMGFFTAACLTNTVFAQVQAPLVTPTGDDTLYKTSSNEMTGVPISELAANAPAKYIVKKGDTLWGISGLFLKNAWKWPQLWGMNKDVVQNPHRIYPGQTLELTKDGERVRLRLANGIEGLPQAKLTPSSDIKLSPSIRSEPIEMQPIASVQLTAVSQFLSQPLIIDEPMLNGSGYVLNGPENRVFAGIGDVIYARGLSSKDESKYQLYRPGKPLRDPQTGGVLAYESYYLGAAELVQWGADVSKLKITSSKEEMGRGDRILPAVREPVLNYPPRAPNKPIDARVMSSYNGVAYAGSYMVVTLNRGRQDGLELGHVLSIWRAGEVVLDREKVDTSSFWGKATNRPEPVKLPDEKYGNVIVFRLFDKVAYALVLGTTLPVTIGDRVSQPQ